MSQIKVKNFGPIKAGLLENDGFIDVRKVTIFIGNQGTGKSSIAKLISTLSWLEKALYRGDLEEKYVTKYNRFVKFCQYQNLTNYFLPETQIEYNGDVYRISFKNAKLSIEPTDNSKYRALSDQNRKDGAKRLGMK
jgi:predicted ATPase